MFTIHQTKIQLLTIESFKVYGIFKTVQCTTFFKLKKLTTRRSQTDVSSNCVNTNNFGLNSLRDFAPEVRNMVL